MQLEEEKRNMEKAQVDSAAMIEEEITMQALESLTKKVTQVQTRGKEHTNMFHSLAEAIERVCKA
jgi:hypothetical protein